MADRAAQLGLAVPEFGLDTRVRLAEALPGFAAPGHPVDFGDPEAIVAAVRARRRGAGNRHYCGVPAACRRSGRRHRRAARTHRAGDGKPLVVAWLGGPADGLSRAQGSWRARLSTIRSAQSRSPPRSSTPRGRCRPLRRSVEPEPALRERLRAPGRRGLAEHERQGPSAGATRACPWVAERHAASGREAGAIGRWIRMALGGEGGCARTDAQVRCRRGPARRLPDGAAAGLRHGTSPQRRAPARACGAHCSRRWPSGGVELLVGAALGRAVRPVPASSGRAASPARSHRTLRSTWRPLDERRRPRDAQRLRIAPLLGASAAGLPATSTLPRRTGRRCSQLAADAGDALRRARR